jgi:hypothetical protein
MTGLRIYSGPEAVARASRLSERERPDVLPISRFVDRRPSARSPLSRAKALHANRCCRFCGSSQVDPVTLNDGMRDGSGQYVPGSATLVGFHCESCQTEWPI